jgi:dihydropteroate synthase
MLTLNCRGQLVTAEAPLLMGIVNLTPDSFFAGSRFNADNVLTQVEKMLKDGADMLDLGAQSTRPGSEPLTAEEELLRLSGIVHSISRRFPGAIISIDTFHSSVARECIAAGAAIINDISGGEIDKAMIPTAAELGAPYICMHMRGTPQTMTQLNEYHNVARTVLDYFVMKAEQCRLAGIKDLIIDPGFGFSKNVSQNFELLKNLGMLKMLDKPILVGLSRKSTVYKTLNITAEEALNGTTVLNTVALMNGANILRVHDVREAKECVKLLSRL